MTAQLVKARLFGYLAEQPLHPGSGQAYGAIDRPVAREGGSDIPVIPGSSHKGSLKHAVTEGVKNGVFWPLFGATDSEGGILFSDIRLLLLPVRASVGRYRWVTSPYLLERFARDLERSGMERKFTVPAVEDGKVLTQGLLGEQIYLEELTFEIKGFPDDKIATALKVLVPDGAPYDSARTRLGQQLLIMSDDDFAWFARFGLPVSARNALDDETKSSKNLWYEEHLPADTLMYGIVAPRGKPDELFGEDQANQKPGKSFNDFIARLKTGDPAASTEPIRYLQVGGDETVGRGFCRVHVVEG